MGELCEDMVNHAPAGGATDAAAELGAPAGSISPDTNAPNTAA